MTKQAIGELTTTTGLRDNRTWIFQADPTLYNVFEALNDPEITDRIHWEVKQYDKFIKQGDNAVIWLSGNKGGIYAIGKVATNPSFQRDTPAEQKYWLEDMSEKDKNAVRKQVFLKIEKKFEHTPIFKSRIKSIPQLQNLSILKLPQGTNFSVKQDEWIEIQKLINSI